MATTLVRIVALGSAVAAISYAAYYFGLAPSESSLNPVTAARADAHQAFADGDFNSAEQKLTAVIESGKANPDPQVQDQVASAGMTLGYLHARRGDYVKARETFISVSENYAGTDALDPDFGKLDDQAAYQAIVCLQAEGKIKEATAAYIAYIETRPLSPLVHAIYKRLTKDEKDQGKRDEYQRLLQTAITKQEAHARAEIAACGPRVILELFRRDGTALPSIESLTKQCGTNDKGTTLEGMVKALTAHGYSAEGHLLNRVDFAKTALPAIWLAKEHYLLLTKVEAGHATAYDPMTKTERKFRLPAIDDAEFTATVLTLSRIPETK